MKQKVFTIAIIFITVFLLAVVIIGSQAKKTNTPTTPFSKKTNSSTTSSSNNQAPIFFYGDTCPHCADVEEWMRENKIEKKIKIVKKEVYKNQNNALELIKTAKDCGLSREAIGVPFLYTPEGKCLIGAPDIINYLSDKAGLSNNTDAASSGKKNNQ